MADTHEFRVVWPEDRSDDQQKTVDEQNLNDLPEELGHSYLLDSTFIGVPDKTTVFNVYFEPSPYARIPPDWLKKAQSNGWGITHAHTHGKLYGNRTSSWLGAHVPVLGSVLGEEIMTVRVHRTRVWRYSGDTSIPD